MFRIVLNVQYMIDSLFVPKKKLIITRKKSSRMICVCLVLCHIMVVGRK